MKDKKHIDELFQERFQDFEATPSPDVWSSIEAKLGEKKKERRVIPLWWRVAGVAALLALLLTVGLSLFNTTTSPSNEIVTEEHTTEDVKQNVDDYSNENGTFNKQEVGTPTEIASEDTEINSSEDNSTQNGNTSRENLSDKNLNTTVADTQNNTSTTNNKTSTAVAKSTSNLNKSHTNQKANKNYNQPKNASTIYNTTKEAVATSTNPQDATNKTSETTKDPLVKDPNTKVVSDKEAIAVKVTTEKNSGTTPVTSTKTTDSKTAVAETSEKKASEENGKSIFDAIEENNKLEEAITVEQTPSNRWAVSPNVGPVYYSSLSGGSSIDPMFSDNSQSGDVNLSYGVAVDYAINEKLSVRSGLNNVNLSYATGDVQVASAPASFALKNIDYGSTRNTVTTVFDKGAPLPATGNTNFGPIIPKATGGNAEISQNLQYYEVPLELKYAVLNKKFGVNVIGGMSTLFLGNNDIVVNDGDFRTVLGEANNLNTISFTSNIGLGFNYQLSTKFRFNIEPMFKYQLNPYTDSSIDFKPYYLGVYSGLSFKF
jgi:hypothetical protein